MYSSDLYLFQKRLLPVSPKELKWFESVSYPVPDVNECENELQCPGKECVNSVGSFRCVSCQPGFEALDGQCQGIAALEK